MLTESISLTSWFNDANKSFNVFILSISVQWFDDFVASEKIIDVPNNVLVQWNVKRFRRLGKQKVLLLLWIFIQHSLIDCRLCWFSVHLFILIGSGYQWKKNWMIFVRLAYQNKNHQFWVTVFERLWLVFFSSIRWGFDRTKNSI